MEEARARAFRTLKPPCVDLSQVALRYKGKKAAGKDLIQSLQNLLSTLTVVSREPNALDPKLADYAFFPLSHIFRDAKDLPVRVVEIALQCLQVLIAHGWRKQLSSDLGKQLLLLLCFLAGGSATNANVKDVNEELGAVAFECLASLFEASRGSFLGQDIIQSEGVPILGHCVTVILDGITDGPSLKVRLEALTSLDSMIEGIGDYDALKNVFPGIVSSLTKVLSLKSGSKLSSKVLMASLSVLTKVICKVMDDDKIGDHSESHESTTTVVKDEGPKTGSWATATASQIKMALANVLPLRYHEGTEVRTSLYELCISIIQRCRNSLSHTVPMLTETLLVVCSQSSEVGSKGHLNLQSILTLDTGLREITKSALHDWIVALPRVMQSNETSRKQRTIDQISTAFKILQNQDTSFDMLNDLMATNLQAGVATAIRASSKTINNISEDSLEITQTLQSTNPKSQSISFGTIIFNGVSDKSTMMSLTNLAIQIKALPESSALQQGIIDTLRTTTGEEQLAGLWLSLQLLQDNASSDSVMDQYLNLPADADTQQPLLDDVYAFSLDVLATSTFEDEGRSKLQALALEAVALQARRQGYDFRPELVDALYPVLERIGSSNALLQQHAVTCLNIVSSACDYPNAAALIVDNADYLVNAVALKLNTFDISPQAPQVLVMMVRLSGAALIPYLDDLVESVFSILACYHGYPKLVESLFSVLNAIVEEAAKSSTHSIKAKTESTIQPHTHQPTSITDLASILHANLEASTRPLSPPPSPPPSNPSENSQPDSPPRSTTPPPPPLTRTHTLIQSIATLTPSHLTTPSSPLRTGILNLLTSALPLLATNTDTFLPLAATLWPAITARLYDSEAYTTLAAADALTTLCTHGGDFLAQRVEDEWGRLCKLYASVDGERREEARVQGKRSQARGMKWKVWDAVVRLVISIVRDVGVTGEMEDGVFEMLGGLVGERMDVREVLEGLNADALWLVEEQARINDGGKALQTPDAVDGVQFRSLEFDPKGKHVATSSRGTLLQG